MQKYYVYIWFIENTKEVFYVGKGSGNRVTSMKDRNPHFRHIRNKCNCGYEIVKYFDNEDEAYAFELKLGKEYKSKGQAWCCYALGEFNKFVSDKTKKKISKTLKGNTPWNKGKRMSDEHRTKLSEIKKGTRQTDETKKRRSIALKGHSVSIQTRKKIAASKIGSKNPMFGKKQSEETINKRIAKITGHIVSDETKAKIGLANGKRVAKMDVASNKVLEIYNSASEAARLNKMRNGSISKCCRGERKTSGGFKWEYLQ